MGIIYIISIVILLSSFILIKKTEKEINIVSFIGICIVALFCYNTFLSYILTFFLIPITLGLLAFINLAISTILILLILKVRKIQKYIFNKKDTIYVLMIALITLIVSYINFGIPLNIKYETSDPSVHYLTAVKFAESEALLPNIDPDEVYGTLNTRKTVSYVNSGLLMKSLCQDLKPME